MVSHIIRLCQSIKNGKKVRTKNRRMRYLYCLIEKWILANARMDRSQIMLFSFCFGVFFSSLSSSSVSWVMFGKVAKISVLV